MLRQETRESIVFRELFLLLHYPDVNLESTADTVILHIGTTDTMILHIGRNDLLKGISIDSFVNFIGNVEHMVQKCRGMVVKLVFLSDIIYTKRIAWSILNDVHDRLLSLCQRFEISYIDNRNIREAHLFKDSLRLLDTDKRILANNFIFDLNNF